MSNHNIAGLIVRFSDGGVNVSGSVEAFRTALIDYVKGAEETNRQIDSALNAVFDKHPGKRMPVPTLISLTLGELKCSASEWTEKTELVHAYLKSNPTFSIKKGKGGGCARVSDTVPVAAAAE